MSSKFPLNTAVGVDGQSRRDFAANIEEEIKTISREIRDGTYTFEQLRPIPIDKANGKIRLINVPTIRDRFVQRIIIKFFKDNYSKKWKLPHSFSSMGGDNEGTHDTLRKIQSNLKFDNFVIRADLSKFFDTIDRNLLIDLMKRRVVHRSFHKLIISSIHCETAINSSDDKSIFTKSGLTIGRGIRQGMPISPVLAFLFLSKIDAKHTAHMFRYIDDMVFFHSDEITLKKEFFKYVRNVENLGLKVHPLGSGPKAKTQLYKPQTKIEFLGIDIVRKTTGNFFAIPSAAKAKIKERALQTSKFPEYDKKLQKRWILMASQKANGLIRDYRTAYGICENWDSFSLELKETQIAMCRNISKGAAKLAVKGNKEKKEMLLRAFGISD